MTDSNVHNIIQNKGSTKAVIPQSTHTTFSFYHEIFSISNQTVFNKTWQSISLCNKKLLSRRFGEMPLE